MILYEKNADVGTCSHIFCFHGQVDHWCYEWCELQLI